MSEVQCPICEFVVDLDLAPEAGLIPNLAESLGLTGMSSAVIDYLEHEMAEHLITHSVNDWVLAIRQADVYIEQLEDKLDSERALAKEMAQSFQSQLQRPPAPQILPGTSDLPPPILPPEWGGNGETPRQAQERARAIRKAGLWKPPTQSLIPQLNPGTRPEGAVGMRF